MIVFIISCLLVAFLAQNQNPYLLLLTSPIGLGVSAFVIVFSLGMAYFKKTPSLIWHDTFSTAALLLWYGYWQPQFDPNAPMFVFFPLYFALFASIVTWTLILKSQRFDTESVLALRHLNKIIRFDMPVAVVFVLVSIAIPEHYGLYMIAMTFFIMRHTIIVCLEAIDRA
jgi:hypothetical protein